MGKSSWRYASFTVSLPLSAFALDGALVYRTDTKQQGNGWDIEDNAATCSRDARLDHDSSLRLRML